MYLFRFLAILFLVYVIYYLIRGLFRISGGKRKTSRNPNVSKDQNTKKRKIISKDEGEYVDFEEVD